MTLTAILLALLIAGQFLLSLIGAPLSQYFVGTWVNLIIATTALVIGWPYALSLALLSPFVAFFLGLAPPFIEITPFIALGNGIFAMLMHLSGKIKSPARFRIPISLFGVAVSAFAKAGFMYVTIVLLILPTLPLSAPQMAIYGAVFSLNQLPTALIGGGLAIAVSWPLKQALAQRQGGHK